MITKENYKQKLFEFAKEKYRTKLKEFYQEFKDEFPYDYEGLEEELAFKNWIDWLMIEKSLPETGNTIVEEFVGNNPGLPLDVKEGMLRMKNVVNGGFKVVSVKRNDLQVKHLEDGKGYSVHLYGEHNYIRIGGTIEGRIHPFDEQYRFCGVFQYHKPSPFSFLNPGNLMENWEQQSIKEIENKVIMENQRITSLLGNYPFQWVDGICGVLGVQASKKREKIKLIAEKLKENLPVIVENLNGKPREALQLVLKEGGFVKYGQLKNFDDDIHFWWNEKGVPTSTIGVLQSRGLLFIGKMPLGKMYKVALIPREIRENLKKLL